MVGDDPMARGLPWYLTLIQSRTWKGEPLEALTDTHRRNLIVWLRRHGPAIVNTAYWGAAAYWGRQLDQPHGDHAYDAIEDIADREADAMLDDPLGWLDDTPLMRRLLELSPPFAAPPAPPLPHEVPA